MVREELKAAGSQSGHNQSSGASLLVNNFDPSRLGTTSDDPQAQAHLFSPWRASWIWRAMICVVVFGISSRIFAGISNL
jgi:hypothetical protein